jgi:acetyl esterase/lipase
MVSTFVPHVAPPSKAGPPSPGARRIAYGPAPQQFGDLRLPEGRPSPHPLVVIVHGGAYRNAYHLDLMDALADELTARGFATWNIEYRRMGDPGAPWPGLFQDVAAAADRVLTLAPAYGLDLRRVYALGHSAGGHLALWLAGRGRIPAASPLAAAAHPLPVHGVVAIAPVTDLDRFFAGRPEIRPLIGPGAADRAAVDPYALLPLGVPQVVAHGVEDRSVDVAESRRYVAAAVAAGDRASLLELAGAEHFAPIRRGSAAWERVAAALVEMAGA